MIDKHSKELDAFEREHSAGTGAASAAEVAAGSGDEAVQAAPPAAAGAVAPPKELSLLHNFLSKIRASSADGAGDGGLTLEDLRANLVATLPPLLVP